MAESLINKIIDNLNELHSSILIIENNDRFLFRKDVQLVLESEQIFIATGSNLEQRIAYELRPIDSLFIFLNTDERKYCEDIELGAKRVEFFISDYFLGYHFPSLKEQPLEILERIPDTIHSLNKRETEQVILSVTPIDSKTTTSKKGHKLAELSSALEQGQLDWRLVPERLGQIINETIGSTEWKETEELIRKLNEYYHQSFTGVMNLHNSSFLKSPKVVSQILPHLEANYKDQKIAMIVIDGLGYWQYQLIKNRLPGKVEQRPINSWLPSITQLSRQSIFKGDIPEAKYQQGPLNEEKLWKKFWSSKGTVNPQIKYFYQPEVQSTFSGLSRVALVYKDLDSMMHGCEDYEYLKSMTQIWLNRTSLFQNIELLLNEHFTVFITTDHGNIQAKGWRSLSGKETLGTNKSGSRSQRHLEYSDRKLYDAFIDRNQELEQSIVKEEQSIYFKDELSFSKEDSLVTHGGAHILEMLIPFVKISHE